MQFTPKREQTLTISRFKWSSHFCVSFWRPQLDQNKPTSLSFTISPSIGTGPDIELFQKLEGGEPSDKVLSWRAAIKWVTWQLLSKFSCSLSVRITRWSWNAISGPEDTCKLLFRSYIITYRLFTLAKTDAEICHTYPRIQTDSGYLAFSFGGPLGRHREGYLPVFRLYKEHTLKSEYKRLICYSCELWPCVGRTLSRNHKD